MREFLIEIGNEFSGKDIKSILTSHLGLSSAMITRLKSGDSILLNGKREFVNKKVVSGDILKIIVFEKNSDNIIPENVPLDILYEDEDILAVNKPPDMPTHPSLYHYTGTLANAVMNYTGKPFTFRAITRLDRDTSGVVIIAKNAVSADKLQKALSSNTFSKEYLAICTGVPSPGCGVIDAPIKRAKEGIIKRIVDEGGKRAVSHYEVIDKNGSYCLVRLFPKTGRTHQLRLHLSHIGTPILGDFLYGREIPGERTRLHCHKISFTHPITGELIQITAPLPRDMNIYDI